MQRLHSHSNPTTKISFLETPPPQGKSLIKRREILIPANGNCLFTTVFVGYLLPVVNDQKEFSIRLERLVGPVKNAEYIRNIIRSADIHKLLGISNPNNSTSLIERFKAQMGLRDRTWGGLEEIKVLSERLNVNIQELRPGTQQVGYVESDLTFPPGIDKQNHLETINILCCNPLPEECEYAPGDWQLQAGLKVAALESNSQQHFRLIKDYQTSTSALVPMDTTKIEDDESSDSEQTSPQVELPEDAQYPIIKKGETVSSELMTLPATHEGKPIRIKGNQIIFWSRNITDHCIAYAIKDDRRQQVVNEAVANKTAAVKSAQDWLVLEGLFDTFPKKPARKSPPFFGILSIHFGESWSTTVAFDYSFKKTKRQDGGWVNTRTNMLYAFVHDPKLINFLVRDLKLFKYKHPENRGLSYPDIMEVIQKIKTACKYTDAQIAQRHLEVLKGNLKSRKNLDLFLAYFNAVLFGSEASRNTLGFITAIMILELIGKGQLTYEQAFKSPKYEDLNSGKKVNFAAYPMTSPYTGANNFLGYLELMETTWSEESNGLLTSEIGMKLERQFPQWSQIPLKEALLIKFWLCSSGLFQDPAANSDIVLISCAIQRAISNLLSKYFSIPVLSPIPKSEYDSYTRLGIHPIAERLGPTPLTSERVREFSTQGGISSNDLNMVYVTPREDYLLLSSYYKMEKLRSDAYYDECEARAQVEAAMADCEDY